MKRMIAALVALLAMTGAASAWTTIYEEGFDSSNGGWEGYYATDSAGTQVSYEFLGWRPNDDSGSVATCCVLFRDDHHVSPGIGMISFLGYQRAASIGLSGHTHWEGVRITLRVRAMPGFTMPALTRINWWMQREAPAPEKPGTMWNMAVSAVPIDEEMGFGPAATRYNPRVMATDWIDIQFILSSSWRDWTCYGSRPDKMYYYKCPLSPGQFLNGPMTNFGLHFITYDDHPTINLNGEFRMSLIRFEVP